MHKECDNCGSGNIRDDYDERRRRVIGRHCFMCGSKNIIEKEVEKEEGMSKKQCSIQGCVKNVFMKDLCYHHYTEQNGPYEPKKKIAKHGEKKRKAKNQPAQAQRKPRTALDQVKVDLIKTSIEKNLAAVKKAAPTDGFGDYVRLDFTGHEELLQRITAEAQREFRPVQYQILYYLNNAVLQPAIRPER